MDSLKDRFPQRKHGKLKSRVDGPFKVIEKIGKNAYKFELLVGYNISPTFNGKDSSHLPSIGKI